LRIVTGFSVDDLNSLRNKKILKEGQEVKQKRVAEQLNPFLVSERGEHGSVYDYQL